MSIIELIFYSCIEPKQKSDIDHSVIKKLFDLTFRMYDGIKSALMSIATEPRLVTFQLTYRPGRSQRGKRKFHPIAIRF